MKKNNIIIDHTLIIHELERRMKFHNWDFILSFLPKGSFLVGGYIRDIILGRMSHQIDVDIVVPSNAIQIGKKISLLKFPLIWLRICKVEIFQLMQLLFHLKKNV